MKRITLSFFLSLFLVGVLSGEADFCFDSLSIDEIKTEWAKEYQLAVAFASNKDYKSALYSFKRAQILCPKASKRYHEIEYGIILNSYLKNDFKEAITFFETSSLLNINSDFNAYLDLLVILFQSYEMLKENQKSDSVIAKIEEHDSKMAQKLQLAKAVYRRDINSIESLSKENPKLKYLTHYTQFFLKHKKSETVAKILNGVVPGLGYWYLGQKKAAVTSFCLNALLIYGTVQLFVHRYYTLGSVAALIETGWYFGGIYGAKHSTELFNEVLYESYAQKIFFDQSLDPKHHLHYVF